VLDGPSSAFSVYAHSSLTNDDSIEKKYMTGSLDLELMVIFKDTFKTFFLVNDVALIILLYNDVIFGKGTLRT
jgi:hypothetical protein